MATKHLKNLIKASNGTTLGTSGQSFKNNVTDAVSGARMTDYNMSAITNFSSSDYYATNPSTHDVKYSDGAVIHFAFDFTGGSRFPAILQPGSSIVIEVVAASDPPPTPTVDSISLVGLTGNSIALKLHGRTGGTPGQYDDITFHIIYPADPGSFNDAVQSPDFQVTVMRTGGGLGGGGSAPASAPSSPTIAHGAGFITAGWTNTLSNTVDVHFERWNGSAFVEVNTLQKGIGDTSATLSGLTAGDQYRTRERYYNGYGAGPYTSYSATATVDSGSVSPPTDSPTSPSCFDLGSHTARGAWSNTSSTESIRIYWNMDGTPFDQHDLAAGTTQNDEPGMGGHFADFTVLYFNSGGEGPGVSSSSVTIA